MTRPHVKARAIALAASLGFGLHRDGPRVYAVDRHGIERLVAWARGDECAWSAALAVMERARQAAVL